jgi:hypothetical protein
MMNTDTMIALAADKRTQYMATAARERLAGGAATAHSRRLPMQGFRFSIGAALIAAGGRLQGVATSLPEPPTIVPALPVGRSAQ